MEAPIQTQERYRSGDEMSTLAAAMAALRMRLPPGWELSTSDRPAQGEHVADALITLVAPDGAFVEFTVEVKQVVDTRDALIIRNRWAHKNEAQTAERPIVVARYISPQARRKLSELGIAYADSTGNLDIRATRPGLYLADRGADKDPLRGPGRPKAGLDGKPAASVVRALIDFNGAWTIRRLVQASQTSTGSVYRVVDYLISEELLQKDSDANYYVPDWPSLLRRWSRDYEFVANSRVSRWIAVRGLDELVTQASTSQVPYAATGTIAAAEWIEYAPARSAMIYTPDAERAADQWGLRTAEAGANVMLAEPKIDVVFSRARQARTGLMIAAPAQVAVDLMTGPGCSPSEADQLIHWMQRHEQTWRKPWIS